jgi:hypothetical protein
MIPCFESWTAWHVSHDLLLYCILYLVAPLFSIPGIFVIIRVFEYMRTLMSSSSDPFVPPPIYAQQPASSPESDPQTDPQILIIPATDSLRFQQGFLGADGERAAIEGELQLKGAHSDRWRKLSVVIST